MIPAAEYPVYAGLSKTRTSTADLSSPDGYDWAQMVAEVLEHQTLLHSIVRSFTVTTNTNGTGVCDVVITATDGFGNTVAGAHLFDLWLSDDTVAGAGLTATLASGTVTNKTSGGTVWNTYTAKKALAVQSLATGIFTLEITDSAKTAFVVCAKVPGTGLTQLLATLATASYGA